jgi:hypothetical protein
MGALASRVPAAGLNTAVLLLQWRQNIRHCLRINIAAWYVVYRYRHLCATPAKAAAATTITSMNPPAQDGTATILNCMANAYMHR